MSSILRLDKHSKSFQLRSYLTDYVIILTAAAIYALQTQQCMLDPMFPNDEAL